MLEGQDLIDAIQARSSDDPAQLMRDCGYVVINDDGEEVLLESKFRQAYNKARRGLVADRDERKDQPQQSPDRLKGWELVGRIAELSRNFELESDARKSEIIRECGYVSVARGGAERVEYTAFYGALMEAEQDPACAEFFRPDPAASEAAEGIIGIIERCAKPSWLSTLSLKEPVRMRTSHDDLSESEVGLSEDRLIRSIARLREVAKSLYLASAIKEDPWQPLCAIRISYSGSGHSGETELFYLMVHPDSGGYAGSGQPFLPLPSTIECLGQSLTRDDYEDVLKTEAWAISYNTHGSWWYTETLEESGSGYLLIDLESFVITGRHTQVAWVEPSEGDESGQHRYITSPYYFAQEDQGLLIYRASE